MSKVHAKKSRNYYILLVIAFVFSIVQNANAQIRDGEATVNIGESTTVYIGAAYQRTLSKATGISYTWTCSSQLQITSKTKNYAVITGETATTSGKLYYHCSYNYDGYYRTMDLYYDIVVKNSMVYVTKVVISPSSATMEVGSSLMLKETIYPSNATTQSVSWTSSTPSVAYVTNYGFVTATSPGITTIECWATDGSSKYATCVITVLAAEPTGVNITTEETTIEVGDSLALSYSLTPLDVTTEVEWTSDNTSVAIVDENGVVTAVSEGTANITITTANGLTDTYHVTVIAPEETPSNDRFCVDRIYYRITDPIAKNVEVINKGSYNGDYSKKYLGSIDIPKSVTYLDNTYYVTSIGIGAFEDCDSLLHITIPNSVTLIGQHAFYHCGGLTEVIIPKSVTVIAGSSFEECLNLTKIEVEEGNQVFDSRENCNAVIRTSTNSLVLGCKNTTIPNSVTEIGEGAFKWCRSLTSINIPESVTTISYYAFQFCTKITSFVIPNSVTEILNEAFSGCWSLQRVELGNSITNISYDAFASCIDLMEIISLNPTPPNCSSEDCFDDVPETCQVKVPAGSKEAYSEAVGWRRFANIIEIVTVQVSTQENNAIFEIPTIEDAVVYTVNVYSDESMAQLVKTTNYDATGKIVPLSTSLKLSIGGLRNGTYYYEVVAKSETGETLSNYTGTFEIDTVTGVEAIEAEESNVSAEYYNMQGIKVANPESGLYIVKRRDKISKELIVM